MKLRCTVRALAAADLQDVAMTRRTVRATLLAAAALILGPPAVVPSAAAEKTITISVTGAAPEKTLTVSVV